MLNLSIIFLIFCLLFINFSALAKDIRHPSNIYLVSWMGMFILLSLGLIDYVKINPITYAYLALTLLSFWLSSALFGRVNLSAVGSNKSLFLSENLLLTLGYISLSFALLYYQSRFGLVNLITNPGLVRASDTGGTGFLGLLIFLPTVIFTILFIQAVSRRRFKVSTSLYFIILLAYMLILPERTTLINTLVWCALGAYATQQASQLVSWAVIRKYFVKVAALGIFVLGFFLFVSERTSKVDYLNSIEYTFNYQGSIPRSLYDPYIYITGNVPALSVEVERVLKSNTLVKVSPNDTVIFYKRFFQLLLGPDSSNGNLTSNKEFSRIPFPFNTYTWLSEPLRDYGLVGSLFYVFLSGTACGLAWSYWRSRVTPLSCFIYSWGATAALFTIMTNKFSSIYFNYALIIMFSLYAFQSIVSRIKIPRFKVGSLVKRA